MHEHSEKIKRQLEQMGRLANFKYWLRASWPALLAWAIVLAICGLFLAFVAWALTMAP